MTNDWIIDVLSDLKSFATENGLVALAGQLDDAVLVAATEISSAEGMQQKVMRWDVEQAGRIPRTVTAS